MITINNSDLGAPKGLTAVSKRYKAMLSSLEPLSDRNQRLFASLEAPKGLTAVSKRHKAMLSSLEPLPDSVQKQIASMLKAQDISAKYMRPVTESLMAIQSSIEPLPDRKQGLCAFPEAPKGLSPVSKRHKAIQSSLEPLLKEQRNIQKMHGGITLPNYQFPDPLPFVDQTPRIKIIIPAIDISFQPTKEELLLIAGHGWYFDFNMQNNAPWKLIEAILKGDIAEAADAFIEYYEERIDEIEKSIATQFPHRAAIISQALDAHRRGQYSLSVTTLIIQADGICKEITGKGLFAKSNKKLKIARYVKQFTTNAYMATLLSPLVTITPINASEHERKEGFSGLNRHQILHGESVDYANRAYSLQALSYINYVSQSLKMLDRCR